MGAASTTVLPSASAAVAWLLARGVRPGQNQLRSDSRQVQPGDAFVAWPGQQHDGRRFVASALHSGATACLVESDGAESFGFADERIARVPGT
jgi:UDP-N-acetylmuramyl pentapeptide synthase